MATSSRYGWLIFGTNQRAAGSGRYSRARRSLCRARAPFIDEHDQPICKYIMFSAAVDHDGDRYGFPRNLMSPQDEVNQRRSKALHELNNRRIIATKAAIADTNVEAIRREAARSDGIVLVNTSLDDVRFDDQAKQAAVMGQLEFMQDAKQEIENFGPNSAMIGGDAAAGGSSGRAIALLQQAGLAGLGPYMFNLRGWKVRVYRALFCAAQKYWTNQRWIRVTDAEGEPQFVQINEMLNGPDGQPMGMMRNAIGELDVDIILDEGPDTITLMQDTYEAISQALPAVAPMLSPGQATAVMKVLIETSAVAGRREEAIPRRRPAGGRSSPIRSSWKRRPSCCCSSRKRAGRDGAGEQRRRRPTMRTSSRRRRSICRSSATARPTRSQIEREKAHNADADRAVQGRAAGAVAIATGADEAAAGCELKRQEPTPRSSPTDA